MPIGSSKLGVLGAGLVPGGTETFNAPGTFSIPPGVKKVSVTGVGGTGNPGNSGTAGNSGNPGTGGGGGGAGATSICATCSTRKLAFSSSIATAAASGASSQISNATLRPGFSSRNAPSAKRPLALVVSTTQRAVALVVSSTASLPSMSLMSATTDAFGTVMDLGGTKGSTLWLTRAPVLFVTSMMRTQLVPFVSQPAVLQPLASAKLVHLSCGGGGFAGGGGGGGGGGAGGAGMGAVPGF